MAGGLRPPGGIAADASGNVYFTNACGVGAIRSDGTFAIVAGNLNSCGYAGNNALPSAAQLYFPQGLAMDNAHAFAGAAPGMVVGINQFNVRVPLGAAAGNSVPIVLKVGSVASPGTATLAVK